MKWLVFVAGGWYCGETGEEGVRVIEIDGSEAKDQIELWTIIMGHGPKSLTQEGLDVVKLEALKGTRLRVFKAEEIPFPYLDAYVAEREVQETDDKTKKKRESDERKLRELASALGFRVEKEK